jgi:hypothetical protein
MEPPGAPRGAHRPAPKRKQRQAHHRLEHVRRFRAAMAGIVPHAWAGLAQTEHAGRVIGAPVLLLRLARRPDVADWLEARSGAAGEPCRVGWGFARDADPPSVALHLQADRPTPCSFILSFADDAEPRAIAEAGCLILKATADRPGMLVPVPVDELLEFLGLGRDPSPGKRER